MYLIELIIKKYRELKNREKPAIIDPVEDECINHIYMPVDNSKNILACKNCGHIIKR